MIRKMLSLPKIRKALEGTKGPLLIDSRTYSKSGSKTVWIPGAGIGISCASAAKPLLDKIAELGGSEVAFNAASRKVNAELKDGYRDIRLNGMTYDSIFLSDERYYILTDKTALGLVYRWKPFDPDFLGLVSIGNGRNSKNLWKVFEKTLGEDTIYRDRFRCCRNYTDSGDYESLNRIYSEC